MSIIDNKEQETLNIEQYKNMWKKTGGFVFYASMYEAIKSFDEDKQGDLVLWIIEYGLTGEMPDCAKEVRMILKPHLDSIDIQKRRHFNVEVVNKCLEAVAVILGDSKIRPNEIIELEQCTADLKKLLQRCRRRDVKMILQELLVLCHVFIVKWVYNGFLVGYHVNCSLIKMARIVRENKQMEYDKAHMAELQKSAIRR